VSIDVGQGIGIHGGKCGDVLIKDSKIFGENVDNKDCEGYEGKWDQCDHCIDRFGLIFASIYEKEHRDRETEKWEWLPLYNYSDCFAGSATYEDVEFFNYPEAKTTCQSEQRALAAYAEQANYVPRIDIVSPRWNNVAEDAVAMIPDPLDRWATPDDCGDWPCSALKNVVARVKSSHGVAGSMTGSVIWGQLTGYKTFSIVSAPNAYTGRESHTSDAVSSCDSKPSWNAYHCGGDEKFGLLLFESLDSDKEDRNLQPITITNDNLEVSGTSYLNIINQFMNDEEAGFYTKMKRPSKFTSLSYLSDVEGENVYDIEFTGTIPEELKF